MELLPPIVTMITTPGMGHLIPMIEFAKRLTHHHNLPVKFIIPNNAPPSKAQTTVLTSLPHGISYIFLPPITLSDLPPNTKPWTLDSLIVRCSLSSLRQTLLSLRTTHRLSALVVDLFSTDAFDVAAQLNIPPYLFFPTTANSLAFAYYFPHLDQQVQGEFKDLTEPIKNVPGCFPVHGSDIPDPLLDRNDESYKFMLNHIKRYRLAKGIIINSFLEIEPDAIKFLQNEEPRVYPVGPVVNEEINVDGVEECLCLSWLNEQPRGSVLFVCFGSGGTLSSVQMDELAYGLEMSEVRFLWVLRCPRDKVVDSNIVDLFDFLPKGFVERTIKKGLVVSDWAPQSQVLRHSSIGGFLSHCGWNSILESMVNGVPLVAWPLQAEQKMNAALVSEEVKVALRVKVGENGLVERNEIASVVKRLMEGEEGIKLRYKMNEVKEAASNAIGENGYSTKQIGELALKWKGESTLP